VTSTDRGIVDDARLGPSVALIEHLIDKYSNWGRWGPDDELGTLNVVTPDVVKAATGLCKSGRVFPLAIPFDSTGPQTGDLGRTNPVHVMLQDGGDVLAGAQDHLNMQYADDAVYMPLQCGTQWDSLAHVFHAGQMYNGYDVREVSSRGANKNGIEKVAGLFVGRGVLLDLPRLFGVAELEPSYPISSEDLERCASTQGVEVRAGDFLLVRTGQLARMRRSGSWAGYIGGPAPGLALSSTAFLCERPVAAVATDTWTVEVWPPEVAEVRAAMHVVLLVHAGIHLGEIFDLEELAEDCASDGTYEFLFAAPAIPVTGGVGSPINPLAIK